jgi:hypothetical protein
MKLSWQLPLIVHIITKYKITHYQISNRKNYFKSTTVTFQGNDVRIYLCLHCITVNNINQSNHIQHSIIKENLEKQFYLRIKSILK